MSDRSNSAFMRNLANQSNRDGSYLKYGKPFGTNMVAPVPDSVVRAQEDPSLLDRGLGWAENFLYPKEPAPLSVRERRQIVKDRRAKLKDIQAVAPKVKNLPVNNAIDPKSYGMDGRNTPTPAPRVPVAQIQADPKARSFYPKQVAQRPTMSGFDAFIAANDAAPVAQKPQTNRLAMLDPSYGAGSGYGTSY